MDKRLLAASKDGGVHDIHRLWEENPILLHGTTAQGNTALHLAIRFGNHRFAARIHKVCPTLLEQSNVAGDTPLHCVAACISKDIWPWAEALIRTLNVKMFRMSNCHGETPLHVALKNRNETIAKSLLKADSGLSDCINKAGESVIYMAANFGYVDMVKKLLESPSTTDHEGLLGRSPLHGAIRAGNTDVVRVILKARPGDINRRDKNGSTPLHYAVSMNHVRLVETLLWYDTSIAYAVAMDGNSPAHLAAQMGFVDVLEKILDHCPDCIDVVDAMGRNVLHVAADNGKHDIAKHILSHYKLWGVVNEKDLNGNTPLHIASYKCEADVLQELVKVGDGLNRRLENHDGHTAIESLPRETDEKLRLKYYQIDKVLQKLYSKDDGFMIEARKKRLSGTTGRFTHIMYDQRMDKKSVVAALIAAVTFTAAFAVPGGYFEGGGADQGLAILTRKSAFKAFMVFDTLALVLSLLTVILATSTKEWAGKYSTRILASGNKLLSNSLVALALAFGTGVYVVIAPLSPSLAIFVLVTCCLFILVLFFIKVWLAVKLGHPLECTTRIVDKLKECMKRY